jgi:hypothetical protein
MFLNKTCVIASLWCEICKLKQHFEKKSLNFGHCSQYFFEVSEKPYTETIKLLMSYKL